MRCVYCGGEGHTVDYCPRIGAGPPRCTYCGERGHNYEACTKHAGGGKLAGAIRVR